MFDMNHSRKKKKDGNFELNLIPVFDILSACICFLLMTAVWIQVGSIDVSQAMGGQALEDTKKPPTVWAYIQDNGQLVFAVKDSNSVPQSLRNLSVPSQKSFETVARYIQQLTSKSPELKTALIMPSANSKYDDLVQLMDEFKKNGIKDIGISPL